MVEQGSTSLEQSPQAPGGIDTLSSQLQFQSMFVLVDGKPHTVSDKVEIITPIPKELGIQLKMQEPITNTELLTSPIASRWPNINSETEILQRRRNERTRGDGGTSLNLRRRFT